MFDDLRSRGSAFDDEPEAQPEIEEAPVPRKSKRRKKPSGPAEIPILGMTAAQRLVIAIMLFLDISVLGCFLLLATQRVVLPPF